MAGLFEKTRTLMGWSSGQLQPAPGGTQGYTWSQGVALQPILPPAVPGSAPSLADAMRCPPFARAIGLYAAATLKLEWDAPADTAAWLNAASGPVSAKLRNVRTVTDLVAVNRALWIRDAREAVHLPAHLWGIDPDTNVITLGGVLPDANGDYWNAGVKITNAANLIYFPGAMPMGALDAAQDSLAHYASLAATIKDRAASPIAIIELKVLESFDGAEPGDDDYDEKTDPVLNTQKAYATARGKPGGVVTVTPKDVDLIVHQANDDNGMLIEARNTVRVDVAGHCNLPASLLDGHAGGSDDYANTLQKRTEFEDLSLALFTEPILARLSMDDVTPAGAAVKFKPLDVAADAAGNLGTATGQQLPASPAAADVTQEIAA